MDRENLLETLDRSFRRRCRFVGRKVEHLERVTRVIGPSPAAIDNVIFWSDLTADNADTVIEEQIEVFSGLGHAFEWILYGHDRPKDLRDRLLAHGLVPESEEEVVVAPSREIASCDSRPDGIEIRRIVDAGGVEDVVAVGDEVWGDGNHDFLTRWLTDLVTNHPEESIVVAAYDGTKPVGAAWGTFWRDRPFAPLFGGSVLSGWRRRGIYRAMVAERARVARDWGIEWCLVDAGEETRPILERMGFQSLTRRISLCWNPEE